MPYQPLHYLDDPNDLTARIWRYMDLQKLLAILVNESVFFPSAKTLSDSDRFEGQPTFGEIEDLIKKVDPEKVDNLLKFVGKEKSFIAQRLYMSCWHTNASESDAMWKIYISGTGGVAVQSTVGRLKACFQEFEDPIYLGRIEYADFDCPVDYQDKYLRRFMRKNRAFEHEKELRAIYYDEASHHLGKPGISVKIDIETLLEKIVVAPRAEAWFLELVKILVKKLGFQIPVIVSAMARPIPLGDCY